MGGNAFKNTVRLTPSEHSRIRNLVLSSLNQSPHLSPNLLVTATAEILDKPSFGDVDLYASCNPTCTSPDRVLEDMIEFLVETLRSPEKYVRNGPILSFLTVERYQVDVGFVDAALLGMYATVHSNGDFARLLQVSLRGRGLVLTTQGLLLRRGREENVSKRERSFLLSVDPTKVGEFLGLPPDAFDGRTSLSLSRAFDLIVANRFFDASAMTKWCQSGYKSTSSRTRPMIESFFEWWHSTGKSSVGNQTYDCGNEEAWADFFGESERYLEWKGKRTEKQKEVEIAECNKLLNCGVIHSWFHEFPDVLVVEVLVKVREQHGQLGSAEFYGWLGSVGVKELRNELREVAVEIERRYRTLREF